jgi:hypothetical protein
LSLCESIDWNLLSFGLGLSNILYRYRLYFLKHGGLITYFEELSGVLVCIIDADGSAKDANVESNAEISWQERSTGAILFEHHLSFQKDSLRSARVDFLWFVNHEGMVLQVVHDVDLPNSEVLKSALYYTLLEIAKKSQHLYNK